MPDNPTQAGAGDDAAGNETANHNETDNHKETDNDSVPTGDAAPEAHAESGPTTGDTATKGQGQPRARHRNRSRWPRPWIGAIAAAVILLAGTGVALAIATHGKKTASAAAVTPTVPTTTAVTAPPAPACPLTGLPAPGGAIPQRPALAIKVDNYPQARPQSGLDKADIVFEEPVEGGITRLVAVFQCQQADSVGPIRSTREPDVAILDQLSKPVFIHAGGIDPVIALLQQGNLFDDNTFSHGSIVQNPPGRYAPYDTYTSTSAAWQIESQDNTPPAPLFTYATAVPAGTPVSSVHIPFSDTSDVRWTWDQASSTWLLSYSGVPAVVASNARIAAANVVIQSVAVSYGPWVENSEGGLEVQVTATGSGPLQVLRNGVDISGTWQRASVSNPTTLVGADGSPISLQPGLTWVELVPSSVTVTTAS
jgi:hypothetical protein